MSLIKFDSSKLTPFVHENELSEVFINQDC